MNNNIISRIDSINESKEKGFTLKLNGMAPKFKPKKIYQVISDMFNTELIEHDVVDVLDGKTKYDPKSNTLTQSIRYILSGGSKVDIFENAEAEERYQYEKDGKTYDLLHYFFFNKDKALNKLINENYRLLTREVFES